MSFLFENTTTAPSPTRTTPAPTTTPSPSYPFTPGERPRPGRRPRPKGNSPATAPSPTRTTPAPTTTPSPSYPFTPGERPRPGRRPRPKGFYEGEENLSVRSFFNKRLNRRKLKESFKNTQSKILTNSKFNFTDLNYFLNEEIDTGEYQDLIYPSRRRNIEELGDIGIEDIVRSLTVDEKKYLDVISSKRYQELCRDLKDYLDIDISEGKNVPQLFGILSNLLYEISSIEENKKKELEEIALEAVLNLPEFEKVKYLVDRDELFIKAELTSGHLTLDAPDMDIGSDYESDTDEDSGIEGGLDEEEEIDMELFDLFNNIDQEVINRKFANYLAAGAALNKRKLVYLIKDKLDKIEKDLFKKYIMIMTLGEFLFWTYPEFDDEDASSIGLAGTESLAEDDYDIVAEAKIFPILIHEIIKGVMDYRLHFALPKDDKAYRRTVQKADRFKYETYALMLGSELEKAIRSYFNYQDLKYYPDVVADITNLLDDEKREILSNTARGKELVNGLINKYKDLYDEYDKQQSKYDYDSGNY
jgi:hypothetical protein